MQQVTDNAFRHRDGLSVARCPHENDIKRQMTQNDKQTLLPMKTSTSPLLTLPITAPAVGKARLIIALTLLLPRRAASLSAALVLLLFPSLTLSGKTVTGGRLNACGF